MFGSSGIWKAIGSRVKSEMVDFTSWQGLVHLWHSIYPWSFPAPSVTNQKWLVAASTGGTVTPMWAHLLWASGQLCTSPSHYFPTPTLSLHFSSFELSVALHENLLIVKSAMAERGAFSTLWIVFIYCDMSCRVKQQQMSNMPQLELGTSKHYSISSHFLCFTCSSLKQEDRVNLQPLTGLIVLGNAERKKKLNPK